MVDQPESLLDASVEALPFVSIVILAFNGRNHLGVCLPSVLAQSYPTSRREILVVDNASSDGTADFVERNFPEVRLVRNLSNYGFARGNNIGAQAAKGELIAFLNQDTRVEPTWLEELVRPILDDRRTGDGTLACTASKIISWDGEVIDFAGGQMNFVGKGSQIGFRQPNTPDYNIEGPILFACGGSMLIDRRVFLQAGGFDEDYFVFFEDVDLGWRLWVLGYRVHMAPRAITYHRLHASTGGLSDIRKRLIFERNALYSVIKNYDDDNLRRVLPASILLTMQIVLAEFIDAGLRPERYDIRRQEPFAIKHLPIHPATAGLILALRQAMDHLPAMMAKRERIQAQRRRPDAEILPLFRKPLEPLAIEDGYAQLNYELAEYLGIAAMFERVPRHVLVITPDVLPLPGLPTSGAGLRAWAIGQGLEARGHRVTYSMHKVVLKYGQGLVPEAMRDAAWDDRTINDVIGRINPDVVVCCTWYPAVFIEYDRIPLVIDQHGPHMLERAFHRDTYVDFVAGASQKLTALSRADFFTCAGEKQRLYFEPWLMQAGFDLTSPQEQAHVVPVAMSPELPAHAPEGEVTFVYGGVFLPWQDPSLALTALVETLERNGAGRLKVFGGEHPIFQEVGTGVFPQLKAQLERSPRVTIEPMVPHDTLLEHYAHAHVAIDLMKRNPERELAFTTRTVEYLWCGLPVIYNNYSELSEYIREYNAGWVLDPDDRAGLEAVIESILRDPSEAIERGRNAQRLVRERLTWDTVVEPLDQFVRQPRIRPKDRISLVSAATEDGGAQAVSPRAADPTLTSFAPVLNTVARLRRSPPGRALALARRAAKQALGVDRPTLHGGVLVQPVPELQGPRVHAQSFIATEDELAAVGVRFATFGRLNTQPVEFRLNYADPPGEELVQMSANASLFRDGEYYFFEFPPIRRSAGKRFVFSLRSPASIEGDAVTVWQEVQGGDPGEVRLMDGQEQPGRLTFQLRYAPPRRGPRVRL